MNKRRPNNHAKPPTLLPIHYNTTSEKNDNKGERKGAELVRRRGSEIRRGDDDDELISKPNVSSKNKTPKKIQQLISLVVFLLAWVANGEFLQAITNGSIGPRPYDKPVFITWCSYNFMILGLVFVLRECQRQRWTLRHYIQKVWAGRLGTRKCFLACAVISYLLQFLNVLMMFGLECISVSLSNGVYQIQMIFTIALSVILLHDRLVWAEVVGLSVSLVGIVLLVVPPILLDDISLEALTCPWRQSRFHSIVFGLLVTVASAAIGGTYLVSWRVFDEARGEQASSSSSSPSSSAAREGLVDTQMTLAAVGICNLVLGWPTVFLAHWMDLESFQFPSSGKQWVILLANGLVEYLFDASCAVAIYMTSPVIVAVASPLTAPLASLFDHQFYPTIIVSSTTAAPTSTSLWYRLVTRASWFGAAITMLGVFLLQTKSGITSTPCSTCGRCHSCRASIGGCCRRRMKKDQG